MIIDFHSHIFPPSFRDNRSRCVEMDSTFATLFCNPNTKLNTAEDLVASMDRSGVDQAVVMGVGWTNYAIAVEANDYIIESVRNYPSRLIGLCSANPAWGNAALEEVERCAEAGLLGIGELHPDPQGIDITDQGTLAPLMALAEKRGLLVLTHASEPVGHQYPGKGHTTPDKLYKMIRNFPNNVVVCAHWGGGIPFYNLMPELEAEMGNVYVDTAASPFLYDPKIFPAVVDLAGPDHILFGSDYPLLSHKLSLEQVENSALSAEHKESILRRNAQQVLKL